MDGDAILYSSVVLYRHGRWIALWHQGAVRTLHGRRSRKHMQRAEQASFVGYKCLQPYLGMGSYRDHIVSIYVNEALNVRCAPAPRFHALRSDRAHRKVRTP